MTTPVDDPFAGGNSAPAVSFKNAPAGTTVTMLVTAPADLVHSFKYGTKVHDYWPPNPGQTQGNPKMAAVVQGTVNGEPRSFWATKPSSLFAAIAEAQATAGARIAPGGTLHVRLIGEEPAKDGNEPRKVYQAKYDPPAAPDAFAAPPAQAAAPAAPPAAPPAQAAPPASDGWGTAPAAAPAAATTAPPWG